MTRPGGRVTVAVRRKTAQITEVSRESGVHNGHSPILRPREASPHAIPGGGEHHGACGMQLGKLSRPRTGPAGGGRDYTRQVALAALCTLLFLTFLDNTVVSVGARRHADRPEGGRRRTCSGWSAPTPSTFASIMLACGMIGDELGRKKVMLTGAGVFCAGSVLCALAPNVADADRRPGGDGPGRGGQRAGHAVDAAAAVPRRPRPQPGRSASGPRVSGLALAHGPGHRRRARSGCGAGAASSGSTWSSGWRR